MPVRSVCHMLFLLSLLLVLPAKAAGIDDADQRLFQVQQSMAKKGDARAQYYLGEMYEQGLGTGQNIDEAFKWYTKAAAQGDALAKRKLAHRAEIEADATVENAADSMKFAPTPENPGKRGTTVQAIQKPAAAAPAQPDKEAIEEARKKAAQKAAEKEKRRALVRAMILERAKHPVAEPFE